MDTLSLALDLLGALGVFLFGLKFMSEALQKAAGSKLRGILAKATSNRFSSTLSGFLVTCVVQSSSATTVMVVGFVSAGLLTLAQSLGVIFGANIGTTTTAWLVSLLGFKIKITKFALPMIGLGFFSQFIKRWRWPHKVGEIMVGFGLLFLGLHLLKAAIPDVKSAPEIMNLIGRLSGGGIGTRLLAVGAGAALTMIFQSSSAMMAVTLTAAAKGLIDYPTAAALVLGENIGTTITANLAAIGATLNAKRSAVGHFLFNIFGVVWAVLLFMPFLRLVDGIVPGDPWGTSEASLLIGIPTHLSAFHTLFNVINTGIMLCLIGPLERLILRLLPDRLEKKEHELLFLSTPLAGTPELVIPAAQKEVGRMADITVRMLDNVRKAMDVEGREKRVLLDLVRRDEKKTDFLEYEINSYLANLTHSKLSTAANKEALSLLSMINDLERIGDHGEKLAILLERQEDSSYKINGQAMRDLKRMAEHTRRILNDTRALILERKEDPVPAALEKERALDALRDELRQANVERMVKQKCKPLPGVVFSDMLTSFEKMGDHAFNVVEACAGIK
ncbi:MAG: Na/Pi cotransporter family protein [Elusimicrobiota bacterium]